MRRQHHYRRVKPQPSELDMTTFLNLMVVLVPFLLITAVFSRITIVELNLPSAAGAAASDEVPFRMEVIVREQGLEITNGKSTIAAIPKVEEEYDLATLTKMVTSLKRDHPDSDDASVLLEPSIEYDHLIQVMDAVRSTSLTDLDPEAAKEALTDAPEGTAIPRVALFTNISIGDAP
jgi:biopolymer transport protein ExbD